jgi:methylmalonyl-CoA mutase N-terminal domain/subunit
VDPLGGSYYIERITNDIEAGATAYLQKIENLGGMLKAIESGFVQKEIQESAYRAARGMEQKEEIVVGVNAFRTEQQSIEEILRINPEVEQKQIERVRALRKKRDQNRVNAALKNVEAAVLDNKNIMEPLIEALEVYATLGEISDLLRQHFGEYHESAVL